MLHGIGTFSQEKKRLFKRFNEPGSLLGYVSYVCFIN